MNKKDIEDFAAYLMSSLEKVNNFAVGASTGMPILVRSTWDGNAAKERIFAWAGWPDNPDPQKAKRAFLVVDESKEELKGSYKDPIADVVDGKLVVISAAISAAKTRLFQTDAPKDILREAEKVLEHYSEKVVAMKKDDSVPPPSGKQKTWEISIAKSDTEKHLVYGVVAVPDMPDLEEDILSQDEIEKMAHNFMLQMIQTRERTMDYQHTVKLSLNKAAPVESYLLLEDTQLGTKMYPKGTWILVTKILDDELWNLAKTGEISAYSITGIGKRTPIIENSNEII